MTHKTLFRLIDRACDGARALMNAGLDESYIEHYPMNKMNVSCKMHPVNRDDETPGFTIIVESRHNVLGLVDAMIDAAQQFMNDLDLDDPYNANDINLTMQYNFGVGCKYTMIVKS